MAKNAVLWIACLAFPNIHIPDRHQSKMMFQTVLSTLSVDKNDGGCHLSGVIKFRTII